MDSSLVADLLQAYESLRGACTDFALAVRADDGLPLFVPHLSAPAADQREAVISSLTQLWHLEPGEETLVSAGLLCASPSTIEAAETLNAAKAVFQAAVKAIRALGKREDKARITRLIERALHIEGRRTEELREALATARINRLDLLRCYARVRVLPPDLESISWTWARTHSAIVQVSQEEAVEMANNLTNPATTATVLDLLHRLPAGEILAYKKPLPNQLRANLVWLEDELRCRKAVTISGVVLCREAALPRLVWRDDPDANAEEGREPRLARIDTGIEARPYILALRLHRYLAATEG